MNKLVAGLVRPMKWLGGFCIAGMMFLLCADVVMRAVGRPITGAVETVGFLATVAIACSLPYTHMTRGHVGVDMLMARVPRKVRHMVDFCTALLALALFCLIAWRTVLYANSLRASGEVSMTLEFPTYFLVYFIGVAFTVLALAVILDLGAAWREVVRK